MNRVPLILCLLLSAGQALADGVPPQMQGVLLSRIIRLDRQFAENSKDKVLFVHRKGSEGDCKAVMDAFAAAGGKAGLVAAEELGALPPEVLALFACSSAVVDDAGRAAEKASRLSLTGSKDPVVGGTIAVGLDLGASGKAEILINQARLKKEGHELLPAIMSLAKVI